VLLALCNKLINSSEERIQSYTKPIPLFILDTTTACSLGSLDALFIRLDLSSAHGAHHTAGGLPGSCQITCSRLSEEMDLDEVTLESALERDNGLDEQRIGVLEINVHHTHHANAHELGLEKLAQFLEIVGFDGGGDELGLFARAHGRRLDVLDDGHI